MWLLFSMWSLSGRAGAPWLIRSVPVDGVRLTASANTIHVGRKTATAEGRVRDPDGRLVAHGTTTCIIHR